VKTGRSGPYLGYVYIYNPLYLAAHDRERFAHLWRSMKPSAFGHGQIASGNMFGREGFFGSCAPHIALPFFPALRINVVALSARI
jgi:hypothetical protein